MRTLLFFLAIVETSADPYRTIAIDRPALLEGWIRFEGTPALTTPVELGDVPGSCGGTKHDESLLLDAGGGLRNVVVTLDGIAAGKPFIPGPDPVLDQQGCVFLPHVIVVPAGVSLLVKNSDPVFHNVHAYTWKGHYSPFNLALPPGVAPIRQLLEKPGALSLRCDAGHRWMSGYVYVASNPYHALTDEHGHFRIDGIPTGTYKIQLWHERLGLHTLEFTLAPGETRSLHLRATENGVTHEFPPPRSGGVRD